MGKITKKIALTIIFAMTFSSLNPLYAMANETQTTDATAVYRLETVNISAEEEDGSEISLSREEIELMPNATGTITDLFRGDSNIQFDKDSRNANAGGEITPPKISINGAKYYENNFTINGIGNNSLLGVDGFNSEGLEGATPTIAPGGDAQAIFLSPSLIKELNVYTENISAEYGDFIGGVVDAELIDGSMDTFSGSFGYRYTDDTFAYYRSITDPDYEFAGQDFQPYFKKGNFDAMLNGYIIKDELGFMLSYTNTHSFIKKRLETHSAEKTVDETRMNENYMLRLNTNPADDIYFALTANYAPYEGTHLFSTYKDGGEYETKGGGLSFILNNHVKFDFAKWTNDIGYISSEASRYSSSNVQYQWGKNGGNHYSGEIFESPEWATSESNFEGGLGNYTMKQQTLSWKSMLDFEAFDLGTTEHNFIAGLEIKYNDIRSDMESSIMYASPTPWGTGVNGSEALIPDKQYAGIKTEFEGGKKATSYSTYAFFLEDTIEWERVTLRPGVRMSYDNIMENFDVAPRLFVNVDVLNDDKYNIYAGYNRYYGSQILSQAINPNYVTTTYMRGGYFGNDWTTFDADGYTTVRGDIRKLKNPYTDEFTAGFSANIYDFTFKLGAVYRDNQDLLMTAEDPITEQDIYTNDGESRYMGLTLSIDRTWDLGDYGIHTGSLSATISSVEGNTINQESVSSEETGYNIDITKIYLDGKLQDYADLNPGNYNSPLTIAYNHSASWFDNRLRLFTTLRWEAESDYLMSQDEYYILPSGTRVRSYETETVDSHFNMDLSLAYDVWKYKKQTFTLEGDIYNVFNHISSSYDVDGAPAYSMGRQFYFGFRYTF